MQISEFQSLMDQLYGARDHKRGSSATFQWLVEEVGELAEALRKHNPGKIREEIADVFAWLASLANIHSIYIDEAVQQKYPGHCPRCQKVPCQCS